MLARALWRGRFLELHGRDGTMSQRHLAARRIAERAAADPETFYRACIARSGRDPYGSASACLAAKQRWAQATPKFRISVVSITKAGRERLAVLVGDDILTNADAGRD